MSALASEDAPPLLFNWAPPRARTLSIAGFAGGSAILHALGFYLFQIVYPANITLLPPPARVAVIAPNSDENRTLLRWVDAEDPALASATLRPPEARARPLPKVQHIPSYVAEEPKLKQIPPLNPDTRAPSTQPPGPVPIARRETGSIIVPAKTRILFSEEFASFGPVHPVASHFTASSHEAPQSVGFRIAVNRRGEISYCFPINSSGDANLDEQARRHLVLTRFAGVSSTALMGDESLIWGVATFQWGNDVAHPPPSPSPSESRP
jgi:hypothetical protein